MGDRVTSVSQERTGKSACHPTVAILERVDDEEIQGEEPNEKNWMVTSRLDGCAVAVHKLAEVELGVGGGHRAEAHRDLTIGRPIDNQVVSGLEGARGRSGVREEQPVQMEKQANVQR